LEDDIQLSTGTRIQLENDEIGPVSPLTQARLQTNRATIEQPTEGKNDAQSSCYCFA
jgi:hypothetical protein